MRSSITTRSGNLPSWGGDPPPPPPSPPPPLRSLIFTSPEIDHMKNGKLGSASDMIFAANTCIPSPRKRSRTKMEDAFRTLSLTTNEDRDLLSPSRKRHEVRPNLYLSSSHALEANNSISESQPPLSIPMLNKTKESIIGFEVESNQDDDSSEATVTVDNTSHENDAVKQVMYSLVFGDQRRSMPPPSSCISSSSSGLVLGPLTHVDAKIEGMIRKSRLQALVMTGKPKHAFRDRRVKSCDIAFPNTKDSHIRRKSSLSNKSIPTMSVQDDFHVNISRSYFESTQNESINSSIVNSHSGDNMKDCEMLSQNTKDNTNMTQRELRRRSKSFDDLGKA